MHKTETESLLTVAKKAIRTNYDQAKIEKTQQNSRCRLCCDGDKTIDPIRSKCKS